jgi:lipopolysaccharide O-acetyltransferase
MSLLPRFANAPRRLRARVRNWLWSRILGVPGIILGDGCLIIGAPHIRIGKGFRAGRMLWIEAVSRYARQTFEPELVMGERISCSDSVHIACAFRVQIGDDVLIGSKVHVTDHNHGRYGGELAQSPASHPPATRDLCGEPVVIGDRVFLGDGVVVLAGSVIGAGTIVGANAVVSGKLPPDTICAGIPARPLKRFDAATGTWRPVSSLS